MGADTALSDDRLAEIEARIPATEHPWAAEPHLDYDDDDGVNGWTIETDEIVLATAGEYIVGEIEGAYRTCVETERRYDAELIAKFVAAAPTDMRDLIAEVIRLRVELAKYVGWEPTVKQEYDHACGQLDAARSVVKRAEELDQNLMLNVVRFFDDLKTALEMR
jgi:hypothetical protein